MSDGKQPYSIHSFMLPLRWDCLPKGYKVNEGKEQVSFEDRTSFAFFLKCLLENGSKWQRKFYRIDGQAENFNEYHYFHSYAATTMFDLQQVDEKNETEISRSKVMLYFELPVDANTDKYNIYIQGRQAPLSLVLCGISLHVYNTGVAILTLNTENHFSAAKEDVLFINEHGRRLYPQFLQQEIPHTKNVRDAFLAQKIELVITGMEGLEDDFAEYEDLDKREVHHNNGNGFVRSWVVRVPKYIRQLFGNHFCFIQKEEEDSEAEKIRMNILTDDRMFFQSWYGSNELSEELKSAHTDNFHLTNMSRKNSAAADGKYFAVDYLVKEDESVYPYLVHNYWYAYLFGDKGWPSIANLKMQLADTERHTYARWSGYGSLFGFTRDSFVSISQDVPTLTMNKVPNLRTQMKTMYYQMAVLCLAQRASVLRFSAEISNLADLARADENEKLVTNIKILYRNYIEFINKINYREITPYIQGLEMYAQFREIMQVQENVKGLDDELNELFTYIKLQEDEKQGDEAHRLTKIATWFLPASFVAALFGVSFIGDDTGFAGGPDWKVVIAWILIFVLGAITSLGIFNWPKKKKNGRANF
jgi:hypothetical protein